MEKILSVVIPSYNAGNVLGNLLSKLCYVKSLEMLDIIVIDDGSTDSTVQVASEFTRKYPLSVRLISKENGGHGSAINEGIKAAKARYFKVVDADDWLDGSNLEAFVDYLKYSNLDLIITPFWTVDDKSNRKKLIDVKSKSFVYGKEYYLNEKLLDPLPSMHAYTLKTSLLKEHDIKLDEHAFYVDVEYILFPIPFVEKYGFVNLPLYNYRINQATQSVSIESMKKNKDQHRFVLMSINQYIQENSNRISDNQRKIMVDRLSRMVAAQIKIFSLFPVSKTTLRESRDFFDEVKRDVFFNYRSINMPVKLLISSNFRLLPLIHVLAIIKMKLVHVNV